MENYHRRPKATKSKFEDDDNSENTNTGSSKPTKQNHNAPQQHGVMVISPNGKIRTYVSRALEILTEADTPSQPQQQSQPENEKGKTKTTSIPSNQESSNQSTNKTRGVLTIKAQGRSITKAVTVAEILKRRMEGSLHQFTEIGQITEQEIWDPNPDVPNLDPLTVSRHRPTIRIRLSKYLDTPANSSGGLTGVDPNMPGASIPRDEHADIEDEDNDDDEGEAWPEMPQQGDL
ncbi:hypothetical protein BGZ49_007877 [Haplosporangium sp. Z 27]|nr:hypothetical protein BGZ49_007877 [Haplosporangium sp. Z 27]